MQKIVLLELKTFVVRKSVPDPVSFPPRVVLKDVDVAELTCIVQIWAVSISSVVHHHGGSTDVAQ